MLSRYAATNLPKIEGDEMEVHQRLTALETSMQHLDKCIDQAKLSIKDLQRTVWLASGAVTVIIGVIEVVFRK